MRGPMQLQVRGEVGPKPREVGSCLGACSSVDWATGLLQGRSRGLGHSSFSLHVPISGALPCVAWGHIHALAPHVQRKCSSLARA